jgi:Predicted membrane protein
MANGTPGSGAPSSNRNVMIVLSYLWLLALIPLLVEKEDREVQWHAKHGLVLAVAELIFWIAFQIVMVMLGSFLSCLVAIFAPLIGLGFLIVHIVAIVKGINGSRLIIPGISQYADKF